MRAHADYEECGVREADVVKLEIRINGEAVDALSMVCVRCALRLVLFLDLEDVSPVHPLSLLWRS